MSNAWFYYVFPLLISGIFVVAGIVFIRRDIRDKRNLKKIPDRRFGVLFGLVFSTVGLAIGLAILLTSPTPWQRARLFEHVYHTPPERIEKFIILPGYKNQYKPITRKAVVIDDPARIRRLAEILAASTEIHPNHPRSRWTATVEMVTADGIYYFSVSATVSGDRNGTLVSAQSTKQGGGWNLGDVCADGLDLVLEEAVDTTRKKIMDRAVNK